MGMKHVEVQYPEGLPGLLKLSEAQFAAELKFLAAAKLFELGKLSSGKAAEMAELERTVFLARLSSYDVAAIDLDDEQIEAELRRAAELAQ